MTTTAYIGQAISRIDGRVKVTGQAKYASEYNVPNLAYGVVVSSAIAKGRIKKIDTSEALALEGVLQVFTHQNGPPLARSNRSYQDEVAVPGSPFRPLYDDKIKYSGQPVALVVAEEFEIARYAATLVRVEYQRKQHETDLRVKRDRGYEPPEERDGMGPVKPRGDAKHAFANAAVRHEAEYAQPIEHHNAMELFATTAV
jgi:xanthine dehydrogenase YagR molybdenum-binding subunit